MNRRDAGEHQPERSPWVLETTAVLLLVLNMLFSAATARTGSAAASFGAMMAPLFLGLLVVGLAGLSKGTRNRRSRAKIFLVTMLVVLLGNCGNLGSMMRRGTGSATQDEG